MELHTAREEIFKRIHAKRISNWEKVFKQNPSIIESAYESMDEYSRLVACEFTKWICSESNGWFILNPDEGIWGNLLTHETKTTEQLFDEFIKEYGK